MSIEKLEAIKKILASDLNENYQAKFEEYFKSEIESIEEMRKDLEDRKEEIDYEIKHRGWEDMKSEIYDYQSDEHDLDSKERKLRSAKDLLSFFGIKVNLPE